MTGEARRATTKVERSKSSAFGASVATDNLKWHHLGSWQGEDDVGHADEAGYNKVTNPLAEKYPGMIFKNPDEKVLGNIFENDSRASHRIDSDFVRANVCRQLWWEPSKVKAAIVTAGNLCPGTNSVIRGMTNTLWFEYGVRDIVGLRSGFNGMRDARTYEPIQLTPQLVRDIHMKGGSILKYGKGGFDASEILDELQRLAVSMVFLVGGPGTQVAGNLLYEAARTRNQHISIIGIPKSIDNDIVIIQQTFGHRSAVTEAAEVVRNAWVEASSCTKGVGIIKLFGEHSGFVAMHTCLASDLVDLCLIPEAKFQMADVFKHVDDVLEKKGYMVIVVASGAGMDLASTEDDASGFDVGTYFRDELNKYLKPKGGRTFYIDPSFIIRSIPVVPNDHVYCERLALDAVHAAMRGYTGVCVGPIWNTMVMVPSHLVAGGRQQVELWKPRWQNCVEVCGMPSALAGQLENSTQPE